MREAAQLESLLVLNSNIFLETEMNSALVYTVEGVEKGVMDLAILNRCSAFKKFPAQLWR